MRRPENTVGYCVYCNKLVRRDETAHCPKHHPPTAIYGAVEVSDDEPVPVLPRFNWAACIMPPLWGPGHGMFIAGLIVLPLWLFADQSIQSAVFRVSATTPPLARFLTYGLAGLIAVLTVALMYWFGRFGWGVAWRKHYGDGTATTSHTDFLRKERRWHWFCFPFFVFLAAVASYYWVSVLLV